MESRELKRVTCALFVVFLCFSVCNSAQSVLLSDIIGYYALEAGAQGVISASQSLGAFFMLAVLGPLLKRLGNPGVMALCAIIVPGVFLLMSTAPGFSILCMSYFLFGFAYTSSDAIGCAWMVELFGQGSTRYNSWLRGAYGIGGLIGPLLFASLAVKSFAWNSILLIAALIAAVVSTFYLISTFDFSRKWKQVAAMARLSNRIDFSTVRRFLSRPGSRLFAFCAAMYGIHSSATIWIPRYALIGLNKPLHGTIAFAAFWFATGVARMIMPLFIRRPMNSVIFGALASGVLLTAALLTKNACVFVAATGIAGFIEGTCQPMMYDQCCHSEAQTGGCGSATASMLMLLFTNIGTALAPLAMGTLFEQVSPLTGMLLFTLPPVVIALSLYPKFIPGRCTVA